MDGERRIAGLCGGGDEDLVVGGTTGTVIGGGIMRLLLGEASASSVWPSTLK